MITLDFETYSENKLLKCGAWIYSRHPSTEILCLSWCIDEGPVSSWIPGDPIEDLEPLFIHINNHQLEAHNVFFELSIWNNCGVPKYGFPPLHIKHTKCSAAKFRAFGLPGDLKRGAEVLKVSEQKDETGKSVMMKLSKPRKPSKKNPDTRWTKEKYPEDYKKLYSYCDQDVRTEHAASKAVPELSSSEQKLFHYDQLINFRGVRIDIPTVKKVIQLVKDFELVCEEKINKVTNGEIPDAKKLAQIKEWIGKQGYTVTSLDKEHVELILNDPECPSKVKDLLRVRQQVGKTSVAKYVALYNVADVKDRRARGMLLYHGANTGRWAGKFFQPHNLPRGTIKDWENAIELINLCELDQLLFIYGSEFMNVLSSCIRGMVTAGPGKELCCLDFSAIEARVLAWFAGEQRILDLYVDKKDPYIDMATDIYNVKYEEVTKDQRFVGKQSILGLGYGMGDERFVGQCSGFGVEIGDEFAKRVIKIYRNKNKMIKASWKIVEKTAMAAMQNPNTTLVCKGVKNTKFIFKKGNLHCILPSGRILTYQKAFLSKGKYGKQISYWGISSKEGSNKKWQVINTYGASLVESIIQALSRDLLANGLINCEENGYPIVFHVHDELVAEKTKGEGDLEEMEYLMCDLPEWANGLPIAAEGWIGHRYRKD